MVIYHVRIIEQIFEKYVKLRKFRNIRDKISSKNVLLIMTYLVFHLTLLFFLLNEYKYNFCLGNILWKEYNFFESEGVTFELTISMTTPYFPGLN